MRRAELIITCQGWHGNAVMYQMSYETVERAKEEFDRISALLKKCGDKGNDIPTLLEVEGATNKLTCDFEHVRAVGLVDLQKADDDAFGLKDAYPHLDWKGMR
jgi:hypothetical protein